LGGGPRPNDRTGGWGDGDLDLDGLTSTGGRCWKPELGGASVVGEGGGRSRLAGECSCRGGVGSADLEEPLEDFGRSGLTAFWGTSVLGTGACCLSSLMVVAGGLTRFGFLARSLVGYNVANKRNIPASISGEVKVGRVRGNIRCIPSIERTDKNRKTRRTSDWVDRKEWMNNGGETAINEVPQ